LTTVHFGYYEFLRVPTSTQCTRPSSQTISRPSACAPHDGNPPYLFATTQERNASWFVILAIEACSPLERMNATATALRWAPRGILSRYADAATSLNEREP
jgi:hypothetical protein